jgi:flagellar protein FliO/FliZ
LRKLGEASVINTFAVLFIFIAILFLAYATSKFLGQKAGKMMKGKNIKIVESVGFGLDKQLHLVRVGDKFILIATSGKNIQMLTEVSLDDMGEISIEKTNNEDGFDFKGFFDKYVDVFQRKISPIKSDNKKTKINSSEKMVMDYKKTAGNLERIKNINNKLKRPSINGGDEYSYDESSED